MHRVLYVIDTLEVGGSERSLLETAARLDRSRFEPHVCSLYQGATLQPEFEAAGIPVTACGLPGKYQFAKANRALRSVVRAVSPDLLHTTLFRANQVGRWVGWRMGLPVVSSFVSQPYSDERFEVDRRIVPWKLRCLQLMDAVSARWVTRFHAVSSAVREDACRSLRIPEERVLVVPRGREVDGFPARGCGEALRLREKLCGAEAGPILLNVGRLMEAKGQRELLRAMPTIVTEFPGARLLIAGEGLLRDELEQLIDELQLRRHVQLLGRRDDVPLLLAAADCFVFPSRYEGLPGAAVEAMLAGCPVVASSIPVMRDLLQDGVTGLLTPPGDADALSGTVIRLLRDPARAERLASEARTEARARFDIGHVAAQMQWLYEQVLGSTLSRSTAEAPAEVS